MAILLAMAVAFLSQEAQAAVPPILHQRPIFASEDDRHRCHVETRGEPTFLRKLPASTRFRDDAQGVRIVSHDGEISGYLLKFGKGSSDKDTVLGYLFERCSCHRNQLYFTTRQVHGVWYGFEGQVVQHRGFEPLRRGQLHSSRDAHDARRRATNHPERRDPVAIRRAALIRQWSS